jgi:hypothetical protein
MLLPPCSALTAMHVGQSSPITGSMDVCISCTAHSATSDVRHTVVGFPTDGTLRRCSGQPKDTPAAALSAGLPVITLISRQRVSA